MQREMKLLVTASALILAAGMLAGCGSSHARVPVITDEAPNPPRPPHGFLVVSIHRFGGPVVGSKLAGGVVSIFNGHDLFIGRVRVQEGHSSRVWLRPGRYSLGLGNRRPTTKRLGGCHPRIATVRVGRTTHYKLRFGCVYH
jgi:hypothetical protein